MPIAASLKKLFVSHNVHYQILFHKRTTSLYCASKYLNIPTVKLIKAVVVQDKFGYALLVLPLDASIDFIKLKDKLKRNFTLVPEAKANKLFFDCESGCTVPFGAPYSLETFIDSSVLRNKKILFFAGCFNALLEVHISDFIYMSSRARRLSFVKSSTEFNTIEHQESNLDNVDLSSILSFPKIPEVASRLLENVLQGGNLELIVNNIIDDEIINQQLKVTGDSLLKKNENNNDGNISHTQEENANNKFQQFNIISHLVIGQAVNKAFSSSITDRDSIKNYWQHAVYCAVLSYKIACKVSSRDKCIADKIDPIKVYLAAFMHNIGLLILAVMVVPEFKLLQKWLRLNKNTSIEILEKKLLGMGRAKNIISYGHAYLGASLLMQWGMPDYLVIAAKFHHKNDYCGEYSEYIHIIQLANKLLASRGIGDEKANLSTTNLFSILNINKTYCLNILDQIIESYSDYNEEAQNLTN